MWKVEEVGGGLCCGGFGSGLVGKSSGSSNLGKSLDSEHENNGAYVIVILARGRSS